MKTGIAVFAYNRNIHLLKTLDGLKSNSEVRELYIFQDGLKTEEHRAGWEKTREIILDVDWCKVKFFQAQENKGLARSIVDGINLVLKENEAVVVLEDDCVPTANFMSFMLQCFEKYKDNKNVYCVSGYSWPIDVKKEDYDIYFTGRISSWGWGTWKDRWEQYAIDNDILYRIKNSKEKSLYLATWGNDLEKMFLDRIAGKNDSWAVYWALKVIELGGACVAPYSSLIQNIGCDGSGVHCGTTDKFRVDLENDSKGKYNLPDNIFILDDIKRAFAVLYGSQTGVNVDVEKTHILIYGLGNYFAQNEKYLNDNFYIEAFVDMAKSGYYAGKRIIKPKDIEMYCDNKIVIMIQNVQECLKVAKMLRNNYNVPYEKILLGIGMIPNEDKIDSITYTEDNKLQVSIDGIKCKVGSIDEYNNVYEVLVSKNYSYYINNSKKDVVIDIGMNIGDATLFFLNQAKTKKVYGFEPFKQTYLSAKDNLEEYLHNKEKLEIFQFGISNQNEQREILYNQEMSCGQSTLDTAMETARNTYERAGLISKKNDILETIEVRKASEMLRPITEKHMQDNLVLKMDCEGDEYGIMQELVQEGLLSQFDFIMLEWHYQGKEILLNYLKSAGFSFWCNDKSERMGLIYAYRR